MARKKPEKNNTSEDRALFVGLSANQVVGYNLLRARELKGWTQDEAADALAPYLGVRWSKATVSQAERSVAGRFVRNFTADEIVAFARAFGMPVGWFFLPPPPVVEPNTPTRLAVPDAGELGESVATLVDLVFGDDLQQSLMSLRLEAFLAQLGPDRLTAAQGRIAALVHHRVSALVGEAFAELSDWQTCLRSMAHHLEDLEARAKRAVAAELDIGTQNLRVPKANERSDGHGGNIGGATDPASSAGATTAGLEGDQPKTKVVRRRRPSSEQITTTRRKS